MICWVEIGGFEMGWVSLVGVDNFLGLFVVDFVFISGKDNV